ncbi:hypothetical protein DPSP01_008428 [Paraphaeosphaeria sporulosa]
MPSSGTNSPPVEYIYVVLHDHYNMNGEWVTDITQAFQHRETAQYDLVENVGNLIHDGLRPEWSASGDGEDLLSGLKECMITSAVTGKPAHWFRIRVAKLKW